MSASHPRGGEGLDILQRGKSFLSLGKLAGA